MTADPRTLRAAAMEADARCNTARKTAEEAQRSQHWPGAGIRDNGADLALEAFLVAYEVAERAWRAVRDAEAARNRGRSDEQGQVGHRYRWGKSKNHTGVIREREAS